MQSRRISIIKQFFIVFAAFLILGIPFKVMVLIEGFTEVRPVNAIPPIAGLLFGGVGAFACGVGNLIADLFGSFNLTSLLGFVGNILAAFIPYRLWYIYSDEEPNLHKNINILKYIFICFISAAVVAWTLGFGLYYCFGQWIESIYTYVFFNNFGFSIGLGMPVFIMLTSSECNIIPVKKLGKHIILKNEKYRKIIPVIYSALLMIILISVCGFHLSPADNTWFQGLSVLTLVGLISILL